MFVWNARSLLRFKSVRADREEFGGHVTSAESRGIRGEKGRER